MSAWIPQVARVEADGSEQLQFANSLLRERRFEDAEFEAKRALDNGCHRAPAELTRGLALLGQRRTGEALECFEAAIASDPLEPRLLTAAGFAHLQRKDPERADMCFRDALGLDSELLGARLGLAQVCHMQNRLDQARQYLSDLLSTNPDVTAARLMLASLHSKAGDVEDTIGEVHDLLLRNPGQAGIAKLLHLTFQLKREHLKYDESIRLLEAATRFNPNGAAAWSWLGRARLLAGRHAEAEAAFREACRLSGNLLAAPLGLAAALIAQARFTEAKAVLNQTRRRRPVLALIELAYGDICSAEHRHDEALRLYCAALMRLPGGRDLVDAAEKDLSKEEATSEVLAQRYRAALARAEDMAKSRKSEHDWRMLARRLAVAGWRRLDHGSSGTPRVGARQSPH